jgi:hypothetical protein
MPTNSRGQRVATNKKSQALKKQSAYAKAMRPGSQSPMGSKKTSTSTTAA